MSRANPIEKPISERLSIGERERLRSVAKE
jgi:hypothetical protein